MNESLKVLKIYIFEKKVKPKLARFKYLDNATYFCESGFIEEGNETKITFNPEVKKAFLVLVFFKKDGYDTKNLNFTVFPNGKISPKDINYLQNNFILIKAQNGKYYRFELKKDKVLEFKKNSKKKSKKKKFKDSGYSFPEIKEVSKVKYKAPFLKKNIVRYR